MVSTQSHDNRQNQSEIARLMTQIEAEFTAARRGLHDYAAVSRHEVITNRFNQAGTYIDQLGQLVGEKEAQHISTQIYIHVSEGETPQEDTTCGQAPENDEPITITARLTWEGTQFLRDHGCHIEHFATGDRITFPARSRKKPLAHISRHCNTIMLPDTTEITSIDGNTTTLLLLINLANKQTVQLTR